MAYDVYVARPYTAAAVRGTGAARSIASGSLRGGEGGGEGEGAEGVGVGVGVGEGEEGGGEEGEGVRSEGEE